MTDQAQRAGTIDAHQTPPLFAASDLGVLLGLGPLFELSWLVPERHWPSLCRKLGPITVPMLAGDTKAVARVIRRTWPQQDPDRLLPAMAGWHVLSILQLLRGYRPGGWNPEIRLEGGQHIEAALARGQGVIFWVAFSVFGDLIAKMALHRAGYAVSHLSRASHGFSASRFGMRCLNGFQTAIEDRYLGERVALGDDGGKAALQTLATRLGENRVVSFTVHRNAKRPLLADFLEGQIVLAPGAPVLALKTGAALLPTFAFRDEAGLLTVTIEAPLELPADQPRDQVLPGVAAQYSKVLEPYVRRYPEQWRGWLHL